MQNSEKMNFPDASGKFKNDVYKKVAASSFGGQKWNYRKSSRTCSSS